MRWRDKVYEWPMFRHALPGACPLCGADADHGNGTGAGLCPGCRGDLPDLGPTCDYCATPLPLGGVCGRCQRRPPLYTATCAFRYESPLSDLLIDLKFHGRLALARPLGELLADHLSQAGVARPLALIPVPLHAQRLRERGYNQALELARPVARRLAIDLAPELGARVRPTASQSNLDPLQRRRNVRRAFAVNGAVPETVAILDDVVTTGSTVTAFAQALRRAGARQIQVWALARAVR